jgi:hypothetical protein
MRTSWVTTEARANLQVGLLFDRAFKIDFEGMCETVDFIYRWQKFCLKRYRKIVRCQRKRVKTHCIECGFLLTSGHSPDCHLLYAPLRRMRLAGQLDIEEAGMTRPTDRLREELPSEKEPR